MRIIRRFVFTAAFLAAAVLLIRAARQYGDFLFMFYPGIMREVQVFLSELTMKMDYLLWERIALVMLIWAGVTLLLDIILQENLLRWVSGMTAAAAFFVCLWVGLYGLNYYAPSIAESMRLDVKSSYSDDQLRQAATYYRNAANKSALEVSRDENGLFEADEFDALAEQVGSGMKNMIRTSYVFGGSYAPVKELGRLSKRDIPSLFCCLTGECCVNPNEEDIVLPYLMAAETAHRMSIARDSDAAFISILSCIASNSTDYCYSGNFMAYRFCLEALREVDEAAAQTVQEGENDSLRADMEACSFVFKPSAGTTWLPKMEKLDKKELETDSNAKQPPEIGTLLVAWHLYLTTPTYAEL